MSDYIEQIRSKTGTDLLLLPSAAAIIRDEEDKILLVYHKGVDYWTTPGGMIEPEEIPADAAVREAWEETGLHVQVIALAAVLGDYRVVYVHGDKVNYTSIWFHCRVLGGALQADGRETAEVRFFSREEIAVLDELSEILRGPLLHIFDNDGEPYFQKPTWKPPD